MESKKMTTICSRPCSIPELPNMSSLFFNCRDKKLAILKKERYLERTLFTFGTGAKTDCKH